MATEVKQRNGAARSARVDDVPAQLGSSGGPTSAQPWGIFATARPPPEIDKQHQPFPGLALSCPYQPHATTSSACVLSPDAPYSPTRGSSTFSPTEALTILTSLGSGNRLAATIRGLLVPPPVVSDQDLRNPKLWDRFRANLAQERLRPLSIGGTTFLSTCDQSVIDGLLPHAPSHFVTPAIRLPPTPCPTVVPLEHGPDGRVGRQHTKRRRTNKRFGYISRPLSDPVMPRFAVAMRNPSTSVLADQVKARVRALTAVVDRMYPDAGVSQAAIVDLVTRAFESADHVYDEEDALVWAEGYSFPAGIGERDAEGIRLAGGFSEYTRAMQTRIKATGRGLSVDSINAVVPSDDPDYLRLLEMVDGIPILTAEDFVPNLRPPPLRDKYVKLSPCVNKLMASLYDAGLIFILPTSEAIKIPGIHFSQTHWTRKVGKEQGRPLGDASAKEGGGCALNSERVTELGEARWGSIVHPTATQLAAMALRVSARLAGSEPMVLWKMDLKGAFTLMLIDPDSAQLLAFALTSDSGGEDLTMAYITGMFGWTCMPAAFQVVTRAIQRAVSSRLTGECMMYVDDLMGCCGLSELLHDQNQARWVCNTLLGPGAVEEKKTFQGSILEWIGWSFDATHLTISIGERNFLRTLHGYMAVDEAAPVTVREIQRLASWASRYGLVCRALRPFTMDLFGAIRGYTNMNARIDLPDAARRAVMMWRCALVTLGCAPLRFARPLHTLAEREPSILLEYDASLTGIGILLSELSPTGETKLIRAIKLPIPFPLGDDSSFQNTVEFMAVVVGLACLCALGYSGVGVKLAGDNTSSLAWAATERFRAGRSRPAAILFMALAVTHDIVIAATEHVPGKRNVVCDALSRSGSYEECGFQRDQCFEIDKHPLITRVLLACDPLQDHSLDDSFYSLWHSAQQLVAELVPPVGPSPHAE